MTTTEFNAAREILGHTDDQLAAELGVTPAIIQAWSAGNLNVPARHLEQIRWLAWDAARPERELALHASGLPECAWLRDATAKPLPTKSDAAHAHFDAIEQHVSTCDVCTARERFVAERFGPMPPIPQPSWIRIFTWLAKRPPWARPAVIGALALAALTSLRVLLALPSLFSQPSKVGQAVLAVVVASGSGAVAGFAYSLTRPTLRRLGRLGDYVSGIVCAFAFMAAVALVAPVAFGAPIAENRTELFILSAVAVVFGLFMGLVGFRKL
jgi:hypothetical protein